MTTKKALKKELEALKVELADTKKKLEKAENTANSVRLYREHCVEMWQDAEKTADMLQRENVDLRARNKRLIAAIEKAECDAIKLGLYNPNITN